MRLAARSSPPRLAARLRQRLDRAAFFAHLFHRYAHHPLCSAYRSELLPIGRRGRVCRGCVASLVGSTLGLLAALCCHLLVLVHPLAWQGGAALCGLLAGGLSFTSRRVPKSFSRGLPSAMFAYAVAEGALSRTPVSIALSAGAALVLLVLWTVYRARGPHRRPCQGCPERAWALCSGFRPIVHRERAFQRYASRLALSTVPSLPGPWTKTPPQR